MEQRCQLVGKVDDGPQRGVHRYRGQGQAVLLGEQDRGAGQFRELDLHRFDMRSYEAGVLVSP